MMRSDNAQWEKKKKKKKWNETKRNDVMNVQGFSKISTQKKTKNVAAYDEHNLCTLSATTALDLFSVALKTTP